jgi:WD40 repeat protein
VRARDAKGEVKSLTAPTSVRGLCFMPKGYRLAYAHYNGVSLWFPNMSAEPELFKWAGSHLDVTVAPDGRFLVSAMQENALHGWRVADHKDMRMTGYPSKTRSFSWSPDGDWLATSGAEACIIWPFQSKDGPMGKGPRECGVRPSRVTRVAFHPRSLVVAIGYDDGWVMICRITDAAEILVRATPELADAKDRAISCLAWSADGGRLLYGAEDGSAGVLDLPTA